MVTRREVEQEQEGMMTEGRWMSWEMEQGTAREGEMMTKIDVSSMWEGAGANEGGDENAWQPREWIGRKLESAALIDLYEEGVRKAGRWIYSQVNSS